MTVADQIASWLDEKGITHAFGIVGGGNVVLWDAIHRLGRTKLICNHHEQAAVMAATYYFRTANKLALALVTTGAGSTNAITGVVAAHMDSIPVLVISGNEASKYMGKQTRVWGVQGYDSVRAVEGVTKDSMRIMDGRDAPSLLEYAHRTTLAGRQGPVWVDIPKDVQGANV